MALEEALRLIDTATNGFGPDFDLRPYFSSYGLEDDFEGAAPIMEKYGLTFG